MEPTEIAFAEGASGETVEDQLNHGALLEELSGIVSSKALLGELPDDLSKINFVELATRYRALSIVYPRPLAPTSKPGRRCRNCHRMSAVCKKKAKVCPLDTCSNFKACGHLKGRFFEFFYQLL